MGINIKKKEKIFGRFMGIAVWLILLVVAGQYLIKDIRIVRDGRPLFILRNLNLSYDSKMEMKIGKIPYDYILFIKNNTPDTTTILIPPQSYPWDKTSNIAYMRYFLYPRTFVNGNERDPRIDLNGVDYVLIDYGETDISQHGYTNIWPKFSVRGEYIIYWDPDTGNTRKDETGIYKYSDKDKSVKWGLIKMKK